MPNSPRGRSLRIVCSFAIAGGALLYSAFRQHKEERRERRLQRFADDPEGAITMSTYAEQGKPEPIKVNTMSPGDEAPEGTPGTGQGMCRRCSGTGEVDGSPCPECQGTGFVTTGIGGA
jgi:hypothetical protein